MRVADALAGLPGGDGVVHARRWRRSAPRSSASATSRSHALPEAARRALKHYEHVSLADEGAVLERVLGLARQVRIDRVECLWEPYMVLAARLREALGLPGMTVAETLPFRDKEAMKRRAGRGGHPHAAPRGPQHRRRRLGGRGAHRLPADRQADRRGRLGRHLPLRRARAARTRCCRCLRHVPRVSVEEFVEAEEFTYDTVCAGGRDPVREHLLVPDPAAGDQAARVDQPGHRRAARPRGRPPAGRDRRWATTCSARWASATASRTWSGTARPTARWCSARSARARRVRAPSTS